MSKKVTIILICGVLISVGAAAVALGYYFAAKNKKPQVSGEKTIISTIGWKQYLNSKFGYQIKYPKDWEIVGDANAQIVKIYLPENSAEENILRNPGKMSNGIVISVKDNPESLSSRDWLQANISADSYSKRDVVDATFNNNPATKINKLTNADFGVYFAREKTIIEILAYQDKKADQIEAMLNTFSFTTFQADQDIIYKVKPGETLSFIASKFNIAWPTLARYNKLKSADAVYAGQKIKIPADPNTLSSKGSGFSIDLDIARYYQSQVDSGKEVWRLDPLEVAKRELTGRIDISENDNFRIVSEDLLAGEVTIEITKKDGSIDIAKLVQPVRRGSGGVWMVESLKSK